MTENSLDAEFSLVLAHRGQLTGVAVVETLFEELSFAFGAVECILNGDHFLLELCDTQFDGVHFVLKHFTQLLLAAEQDI